MSRCGFFLDFILLRFHLPTFLNFRRIFQILFLFVSLFLTDSIETGKIIENIVKTFFFSFRNKSEQPNQTHHTDNYEGNENSDAHLLLQRPEKDAQQVPTRPVRHATDDTGRASSALVKKFSVVNPWDWSWSDSEANNVSGNRGVWEAN